MTLHWRAKARLRRDAGRAAARARRDRGERWREFVNPILVGAALLAGMTLLRVGLVLPGALMLGQWTIVGKALAAVLIASAGGAAGGVVYALVGAPLRQIPTVGPYLAGMVCMAGYLAAIGLLILPALGDTRLTLYDPAGIIAFVACTVLFGLMVGHQWFRD